MLAATTQPNSLADSKGDHSPPLSKQSHVTPVTPDATTQMDKVRVEVVNDFNRPTADSNPNEELKIPKC